MKLNTIFKITLCLLSLIMSTSKAANVVVNVKNIASNSGSIRASLCDKDKFLKDCLYKTSTKAAEGTVQVVFKDVPAGRFAVSVYHDENDNGKLDRNGLGIPVEGYGFSRDAHGHMGPPVFDDAAFDVKDGSNEINMTLNY